VREGIFENRAFSNQHSAKDRALKPTLISTLMSQTHANLCPSTRKPRVDGALWDAYGMVVSQPYANLG
jgi:hypothetical protein